MGTEVTPLMSLISKYLPLAGGTMSGDITLGANKLKTTTCLIKEVGAGRLGVRNIGDTDYEDLYVDNLSIDGYLTFGGNARAIQTGDSDNHVLLFKARDNGVGLVEIARFVGAAEPYFQITRSLRLTPLAGVPGTLVEGMLWYLAADDKLYYRRAADTVELAGHPPLTTTIDYTRIAGAVAAHTTIECVSVTGQGVVYIDLAGGQAAEVDLLITVDGTLIKTVTQDTAYIASIAFHSSLLIQLDNPEGVAKNAGVIEIHGNYA